MNLRAVFRVKRDPALEHTREETMSKSVCLAVLVALGAATPALAQYGENDSTYSGSSFSAFRYRPFHVQIEGGPTIAEDTLRRDLDEGVNIGLGITWQPFSHLPLAIRADGMYQHFHIKPPLLAMAAGALGTPVDWGRTEMWGGDLDAELDTMLSPRVRLYFLAGGGWYDRRDSYFQHAVVNGILCGFYFCFRGPLAVSLKVGEASTGLKFEENAGAGFEFALDPGTSFFVDARYMRFEESGRRQAFIPVRIGLRF
jgi:hypothetical protein